jgi:hypothetical protein
VMLGAAEFQFKGIQFEAAILQIRKKKVGLGAAGDVGVGDAAAAIGGALLVKFLDVVERVDALAHVGGQAFEVTQGFELGLQGFDINEIFVKQVGVDERTNVSERAEGKPFDDFGEKSVLELAETIEQVDAVILEAGKDLGARAAGRNFRDGV